MQNFKFQISNFKFKIQNLAIIFFALCTLHFALAAMVSAQVAVKGRNGVDNGGREYYKRCRFGRGER